MSALVLVLWAGAGAGACEVMDVLSRERVGMYLCRRGGGLVPCASFVQDRASEGMLAGACREERRIRLWSLSWSSWC